MPSCGCRPSALLRRSWPVVSMPLRRPGQQHLPDSSSPQRTGWQSPVPTVPCLQQLRRSAPACQQLPTVPRPAALPWSSGQQHLPDSSLPQCRNPLRHGAPCHQLRRSAPASNKPHPAEKSTPVWLAIWRTWAGFANSQHRDAAFATPDNICAHSSLLPH